MTELQCNIQGRPTPNRYEKRGQTTFQSFFAENVEVHGITEFGDVTSPPRKYLESVISAGALRRAYDPDTWHNLVQPYNFTQLSPVDGSRVEQYGYDVIRPGGSGTQAQDGIAALNYTDDVGQTVFADNPGIYTRTKRRKELTGFTENEPEGAPQFFYAAPFLAAGGVSSGAALQIRGTVENDAWRLNVVWFQSGATEAMTVRIAVASGDRDPPDALTDGVVIGSGTSGNVNVDVPPDSSVRFHISQANGADYFPKDFGADYADAGADLWLYVPQLTDPFCDRYTERLGSENTYSAAIALAPSPVIGTDRIAFTTALSGGTGQESFDPILFSGKTVIASHVFAELEAGHSYTFEATIEEKDYPSGANPSTFTETIDVDLDGVTESFTWALELRCPLNKQRRVIGWAKTDNGPTPTPPPLLNQETYLWLGRALGRGGSVNDASIALADDLIEELIAQSLFDHVYVTVTFGQDLAALLTPIGGLNRTAPTNANFVDADASESTGLQGNGTDKHLVMPLTTGGVGGLFYSELDPPDAPEASYAMGGFSGGQQSALLQEPGAIGKAFRWGVNGVTNQANVSAVSLVPGFFHGQTPGTASRTLYFDGAQIATNGVNDAAFDVALWACGMSPSLHSAGRFGCFGFCDTSLDGADAAALFATIRDFLLTPTGRI